VARRSSKSSNGKDKDQETPQDDITGSGDETVQPEGADTLTPDTERDAAATDATPDAGTEPADAAEQRDSVDTESTSQADAVPFSETEEGPGIEGTDTVEAEPLDPDTAAMETTDVENVSAEDAETVEPTGAETLEGEAEYRDEAEAAALDAEALDAGADSERGAEAEREGEPTEQAGTPSEPPPELEKPPEPAATRTVVERRGPGFVPLVLGGVVAAGLGYLASSYELIPGLGGDDRTAEIEAALDRQSDVLTDLQSQVSELASAEAPSVDLSPVTEEMASLGVRLDETASAIESLSERVTVLEERPVFSGDISADAAEAAEAVAAMEEQMRAQEEEAARLAAEAQEAQDAAAEAIAAAEAEAEAARVRAEAEAALQSVRLAVTEGQPYAEPLSTLSETAEIPEALVTNAESGVVSLEALQDSFPPAARDALPVAIRETAGDGALDRFTAFLQGQVAGRAIEPIEGDGPDAILSRAQAAVSDGELQTALAEISALPEAAQAEMADWAAAAETRVEVVTALDSVAQALSGTN
jgi:hypothetical protein